MKHGPASLNQVGDQRNTLKIALGSQYWKIRVTNDFNNGNKISLYYRIIQSAQQLLSTTTKETNDNVTSNILFCYLNHSFKAINRVCVDH